MVGIDVMLHVGEQDSCDGDKWHSCRVEDTDSENDHHLRIKVAVLEGRGLFSSPTLILLLDKFSLLDSQPWGEV